MKVLNVGLMLLLIVSIRTASASPSHCGLLVKQSCISKIPSEWQPKPNGSSAPVGIQTVCLSFGDYPPDSELCVVSSKITISVNLAGFVADLVSKSSTIHNDDLDLWVKAGGLEPGDAHTINTVTYMQATTFRRDFFFIKNQSDEWHPDVKCSIRLENPEDSNSCRATGVPTGSAGLLKTSSSCRFNQNKENTVLKDVGAVLLGVLSPPIGLIKAIVGLNPDSPAIPNSSASSDFVSGNALEEAIVFTCPDDVYATDNGATIVITRSLPRDRVLAEALASRWNQEFMLAEHLRGEIPKSVAANKGDSYWKLADRYYSSNRYWVGIAQANGWRSLRPGASVVIPPMQSLLFSPCFVRQRESLWTAGSRLKTSPGHIRIADAASLARPRGADSIYPLERLISSGDQNCPK